MDSANLYQVLTQEVIPLFYERDAKGIPRQWIHRIRRAMVTLVPQFTTTRMVREYTERYYLVPSPLTRTFPSAAKPQPKLLSGKEEVYRMVSPCSRRLTSAVTPC